MKFALQVVIGFLLSFHSLATASETQKPLSIIFLDIDGVMIGSRDLDPLHTWIRQKLVDLFGERDGNYRNYTELEWRIAASHFLSRPAVENLEKLIERVSERAEVAIVLSSAWRLDGTSDEIKNRMFATESFSRLIIDKIPDDDWWRRKQGLEELSPTALRKYGFSLETRGLQINYWLLENQEKWGIKSFVIIDDVDEGLSVHFPSNFVEVNKLLSESEAEKAYDILIRF